MSKIKFTRQIKDKNGDITLEANQGNEKGLELELAEIRKGISKPVNPDSVIPEDSIWKSKAKIATEAFPFGNVPKYNSPEALWEIAKEYFIWCDNTPFNEGKRTEIDKTTGFESREDFVKKKQVYTMQSFLNYAGITAQQWRKIYKPHPAFLDVIETIENTIADDKFKGAVAGFYNSTIISRDLGQEDKVKVDKGKSETEESLTIDVEKLDNEKLDKFLAILQEYAKVKHADAIDV